MGGVARGGALRRGKRRMQRAGRMQYARSATPSATAHSRWCDGSTRRLEAVSLRRARMRPPLLRSWM